MNWTTLVTNLPLQTISPGTLSTSSLHGILPWHGPDICYVCVYIWVYAIVTPTAITIFVSIIKQSGSISKMCHLSDVSPVIRIQHFCAAPYHIYQFYPDYLIQFNPDSLIQFDSDFPIQFGICCLKIISDLSYSGVTPKGVPYHPECPEKIQQWNHCILQDSGN